MSDEIKRRIFSLIGERLRRIGIREEDLGPHFDLVRTGLVNSLEFVELVATLEKEFQCEIDYETALENGELTKLDGLVKAFEHTKHE